MPPSPWQRVCRLARRLPAVEESTHYRYPALKVRGRFIAGCKDGENLVLRIDRQSRDLLIRADPKVFFLTEHYRDSAAVLVRLDNIEPRRLSALLEDAWRSVAPRELVEEFTKDA